MRIAIAQQNYHIGNFDANLAKIRQGVQAARLEGADIVVFSELSVCGYPPRDFLEFRDFIRRSQEVIEALRADSHDIAIVVGAPTINPVTEGKDLFNSAYFIAEGEIKHIAHKALLPTYDVFDEYRYFEPAKEFHTLHYKGYRIALTICEDIWNVGNENPLYTICPMDEMMPEQPQVMLNLSASPFSYVHSQERVHTLRANVERYKVPIFYVNCVGAQTELLFDGGSIVMNDSGTVVAELPFFVEGFGVYDLAPLIDSSKGTDAIQVKEKIPLIYEALLMGISDYFQKLNFKQAILGLSGGIDSALVLALACDALGASNVRAVLMPSQFSSDHSISDALQMVNTLGCMHDIVAIKPMFDSFMTALSEQFNNTPFNVTEENLQARIRANILMALSNKFGYILLNTSNKSEAAVGYGTLYGDMAGGISVIGDLYKTEVYALSRYINQRHGKEIIPEKIMTKAPSAELRPNQKDSDSLPEYDILDQVLYQYIECHKGPKSLIEMGFDKALVEKTLRLVNINEYKRHQTPPILRISRKAFGSGRRMPIVGKYLS
jgi:NAD+ synthase (glutamine-hydrolysing)